MGVLEFLGLWIGLIYYFAAGVAMNVTSAPDVALICLGFLIVLLSPVLAAMALIWRWRRRRIIRARR